MGPKDADRIANNVDPEQTAPVGHQKRQTDLLLILIRERKKKAKHICTSNLV